MSAYDAIKAVNWSSLKHMDTSPHLYRWRIEHPEPRKQAFVLGGAIHCLTLEPGKFDARYAIYEGTRRGAAWDEWQEAHPGVESLKPDEMERVRYAAEAVRGHRVASDLLNGGRCEEVLTWNDPETGLACKGRLDYIRPDLVVDLKSARDVRPERFQYSSEKYLYDAQVAFYTDGATLAKRIDGRRMPWVVAVESDEPYDVAAFELEPQALDEGRAYYRALLRRLAMCREADHWPGVAPDPVTLYARRKTAEQTITEEDF